MKEFKFRGLTIMSGQWVYFDIMQGIASTNAQCYRQVEKKTDYIDQNTIGQYTGITDYNGNDIYEDDILVDEKKYLFLFVARNKDGLWILEDMCGIPIRLDKTPITVREYVSDWNATIAGNKHENRELLEQHDN